MSVEKKNILLCCTLTYLLAISVSHAQISSLRERSLTFTSDTIILDSVSIYPWSFVLFCGERQLDSSAYFLDGAKSLLLIKKTCFESLRATYRVFPYNLSTVYQRRDTSLLYRDISIAKEDFFTSPNFEINDVFGGRSIQKSGSISRGISFGNNQDMGVRSSLNLELNGEIGQNLKITASLSDDNMPIQAEGNTSKLQEFDKVFVQLYNDQFKLIAGDFWTENTQNHFLKYRKRAQGLFIAYDFKDERNVGWKSQVSGAFSKGKFNRQQISGIEGNQGPYRLVGAENEPFILILAGTEQVTINGRLLNRGQDADYVINYNIGEIVFTARNQITKDSRIVIEFQYSDQNYARILFQTSHQYHSSKIDFGFNIYSEQDAKNQTIQQNLSNDHKKMLSEIGDDLHLARISSIDSIGFTENQVLYRLIDTLGHDSVLVFSNNATEALYRATFVEVGQNKGDYVLKDYVAMGKVYEWTTPIAGVSQGNFAPFRTVITPKKKRMITADVQYRINEHLSTQIEVAHTKNDLNTFSKRDRFDDDGLGIFANIQGKTPLFASEKWILDTKVELNASDRYFSPIEDYKPVEYNRDWNVQGKNYNGNDVLLLASGNLIAKERGNFLFQGQQYRIGNDFLGKRAVVSGAWKNKGFKASWDGSVLEGKASENSQFIRINSEISQKIWRLRIGITEEYERNQASNELTSILPNSYQFWDYQVYVANPDSTDHEYRIFYRERYDKKSDSTDFRQVAQAQIMGGKVKLQSQNQYLEFLSAYRKLNVLDTVLLDQQPENSLLGSVQYEWRAWKNAFTWNTFYEVASGLEQKREFVYLQVNAGQGIYTWNDYNADGIKDLNEFEIAQYADQANYVRIYTPTNQYTKTFANELNQTIAWRPERIWTHKHGWLSVLSRFSEQMRIRIQRKTNIFDRTTSFNPFASSLRDTSLLTSSYDFRNTVYLNRTSPVISGDWTYQRNQNKNLLASGFDSREIESHEIVLRWNITPLIFIETKTQSGRKTALVDYTSGRNFDIQFRKIEPEIAYQGSTAFRVALDGRYEEKYNDEFLGNQQAYIGQLGTSIKISRAEQGSLHADFHFVKINFRGDQNSSVGFEMLEALQPGENYTWNMKFQRIIGANLQLSVQYHGRKSKNAPIIHSAGMELRAFF